MPTTLHPSTPHDDIALCAREGLAGRLDGLPFPGALSAKAMEFVDVTMLQIEETCSPAGNGPPSYVAFIDAVTEDEDATFSPAAQYRRGARYRKEHIDYSRTGRRIKPIAVIDAALQSMLQKLVEGADVASLGTWTPPAATAADPRGATPASSSFVSPAATRPALKRGATVASSLNKSSSSSSSFRQKKSQSFRDKASPAGERRGSVLER